MLLFHDISSFRPLRTSSANVKLFSDLLGRTYLKNVLLVTTCWDQVSQRVGTKAERDLEAGPWNGMIRNDSATLRFLGNQDSAMEIIDAIASEQRISGDDFAGTTTRLGILSELETELEEAARERRERAMREELENLRMAREELLAEKRATEREMEWMRAEEQRQRAQRDANNSDYDSDYDSGSDYSDSESDDGGRKKKKKKGLLKRAALLAGGAILLAHGVPHGHHLVGGAFC